MCKIFTILILFMHVHLYTKIYLLLSIWYKVAINKNGFPCVKMHVACIVINALCGLTRNVKSRTVNILLLF